MRSPGRPCFRSRASGTKLVTLLSGLVLGCLLAGGPALADEPPAPPVLKPVLQRQLESQILPEVRLHNADFTEALLYLQMQALTSSKNAVRVPFVVKLPADFKPRYELTLDLKSVSLWEALRHLGGQAGVEFSIEGDSVGIRPAGAAAAAKATVRTVIPAPAPAADPNKKPAGRLSELARPFGTGDNNHYTTAGVIQPQRSGTIKHRNLSGWAITSDRGNRLSMNCIDIARCRAGCDGKCGCYACACQPPKPGKTEPKP